jgi:hypothetical protein
MLNLESTIKIPSHVSSSTIQEHVFLLNTRTNNYFALDQVGARFWELISKENSFRSAYKSLLAEFEVDPARLETDLLELVADLHKNELVEIT